MVIYWEKKWLQIKSHNRERNHILNNYILYDPWNMLNIFSEKNKFKLLGLLLPMLWDVKHNYSYSKALFTLSVSQSFCRTYYFLFFNSSSICVLYMFFTSSRSRRSSSASSAFSPYICRIVLCLCSRSCDAHKQLVSV